VVLAIIFILLVVVWIFIELSEVNFFPRKLRLGFTSLIITILIFVLFVGVFAASNQLGDSCQNQSLSCYISGVVAKFPTWIGTFFGVFVGAFLAYELNMKKQKQDDEKSIYEKQMEDFLNINNKFMKALSGLESVYDNYNKYLDEYNVRNVSRGLVLPHIKALKLQKIDVELHRLFFIEGNDENHELVKNLIASVADFNNFVDIFEERNALSEEVRNVLLNLSEDNTSKLSSTAIKINSETFKSISRHSMKTYLLTTEILLGRINTALKLVNIYTQVSEKVVETLKRKKEALGIEASAYNFHQKINVKKKMNSFVELDNYQQKVEHLIYVELGNKNLRQYASSSYRYKEGTLSITLS